MQGEAICVPILEKLVIGESTLGQRLRITPPRLMYIKQNISSSC